jgi:hypothetical protein
MSCLKVNSQLFWMLNLRNGFMIVVDVVIIRLDSCEMCSVVNCGAVWRCCTRRNPMLESGTFFERPRPQNG